MDVLGLVLAIPVVPAANGHWYAAAAVCCLFGVSLLFFQVGVGSALLGGHSPRADALAAFVVRILYAVDRRAAQHYRAIVLEILTSFPDATVWLENRRCDDLLEAGPLTRRGMARMRSSLRDVVRR